MQVEFNNGEWRVVRAALIMCIRYLEEVEEEPTVRMEDVDALRKGPMRKYNADAYTKLGGFVAGVMNNPGMREEAWIFRRGPHLIMHDDAGPWRVPVRKVKVFAKGLAVNSQHRGFAQSCR